MSTYGAKAAPPEGRGAVAVGFGPVVAVGAVVGRAVGLAVGWGAVAVAVGAVVGRPLGLGVAPVPAEHFSLLIRQPVGAPASCPAAVTNPTVTEAPGARPAVSQRGGLTVTCCPLTLCSPFQSEAMLVPAGRSNSRVQSFSAAPPWLVMTYCPV